MDAFWKWLMQANARAVFGTGVVILLLVSGWWGVRLSAPVAPIGVNAAEAPDAGFPGMGIGRFLDAELARSNSLPRNPFAPVPVYRKPDKPPDPIPPVATNVVVPPPSTNRPTRPPPPPPPPPRDLVTLTYRGLLRRPDGKILAWVEDSKLQRSAFYARGDTAEGLVVIEIRESELVVRQPDGTPVRLPLREPLIFEEGKHVPQ